MLRSNIGGVDIDCCVYNASGPRTGSVEQLKKIAESRSGAVLAKSATVERHEGNQQPRGIYKIDLGGEYCQGSINSEGLPNKGVEYYYSDEAIDAVKEKPYFVSVSGFNLDENIQMLKKIFDAKGIDGVELNLACPNIPDKSIVGYDLEQMDKTLKAVTSMPSYGNVALGVKLPPYFDIAHIKQAATVLSKYPIAFIVCCNSIPNGLFIDPDNECVAYAANGGLGGLGGGFVKHTALANVHLMHTALHDLKRTDIDIVGTGGVGTGKDAFELILCGAKAVQVGTIHGTEGGKCFQRIATELEAIMKRKGYTSIEDFRGKLKPNVKPTDGKKVPEWIDAHKIGEMTIKSEGRSSAEHAGQLYFLSFIIVVLVIALSYSNSHGYYPHI